MQHIYLCITPARSHPSSSQSCLMPPAQHNFSLSPVLMSYQTLMKLHPLSFSISYTTLLLTKAPATGLDLPETLLLISLVQTVSSAGMPFLFPFLVFFKRHLTIEASLGHPTSDHVPTPQPYPYIPLPPAYYAPALLLYLINNSHSYHAIFLWFISSCYSKNSPRTSFCSPPFSLFLSSLFLSFLHFLYCFSYCYVSYFKYL